MLPPQGHREIGSINWRVAILLAAMLVVAAVIWLDRFAAREGEVSVLVVSLDTGRSHFRNQLIFRFADHLAVESNGRLSLQVYESGQLMSDRDVSKALALGVIDFAVPADSKIARFDPNAALLSLPIFYGRPPDRVYEIIDGPAGDAVRDSVELSLNVEVLEPVIDLGFTATFSTDTALQTTSDYAGLKIRIPGGTGPADLFESLDAVPIAVPFPDVPLALSQGNLDAIQTTHETVRSAKLWDAGLTHCLEDNANLIQYYPMISRQTLDRLSHEQQQALRSAWQQAAAGAREESLRFQASARETLALHGVACSAIEAADVASRRDMLRGRTLQLASSIGMDTEILELALAGLDRQRK